MKKITMLLAAAAVLLTSACKEKEDKPVVPEIYNIGIKTASVPSTGGELTISFTSNVKWTASSDASWISFDKASGNAGEYNITAKAQENNTGGIRTAEITVSAEDKSFVVPVEQDQNDVFGVNVSAIDASYEGGDFSITVSSNIKFEVKSSADWVTVTETKAVTDSKFTVSVAENPTAESRNADVTVSSTEGKVVIPVSQEGGLTDEIVAAEYIYYGDYYENGTANWVLHLFNEGFYYGNSEPSNCYSFDLNAPMKYNAHDYPSGITEGVYELDNTYKAGTLNSTESCTLYDHIYWEKATLTLSEKTISAVIVDKKGKTHKLKWTIDPQVLTVEDNTFITTVDKDYDISFTECQIESYGQYLKEEYNTDGYMSLIKLSGATPMMGSDNAFDTYGLIGICSATEDITGTYVLSASSKDSHKPGSVYGPDTIFYSYNDLFELIDKGMFKPAEGTVTISKDGDDYVIEGSFSEDYPYGDKTLHTLGIHFKGSAEFVDMSKVTEAIPAWVKSLDRKKAKSLQLH